jgi:hypothetical protein
MRHQCFSLLRLWPIVLLVLLMLCVPLAWTQRTLLAKQTLIQISDPAASQAALLEARTRQFPSYGKMPLNFTPNLGQTRSGPGFPPYRSGYNLLPSAKTLLELNSKANYFVVNAPQKWQTSVPTHTYYQRVYPSDLRYYGRRVPLVGPVILLVLKQAEAHPRVARVLQLLKPQF